MPKPLPPRTRVLVPTKDGPRFGTVENRRHGNWSSDDPNERGWVGPTFTRTPRGDYFIRLDGDDGEFVRAHESEVEVP